MIFDLPEDYQPAAGDWRIEAAQDGTFYNAVYTGSAFAHMERVQAGQAVKAVTEGLTFLGRCNRAYYYRAEPEPGQARLWPWMAPKNESNSTWLPPRFTFGQLVWDRRNPTAEPQVVTGISFVPAFHDEVNPQSEDTDESTPQTWAYVLDHGRTVEASEEDLLARADLARLLAGLSNEPVPVPAGAEGFDSFLESDVTLP
jgi:hypothetical protein